MTRQFYPFALAAAAAAAALLGAPQVASAQLATCGSGTANVTLTNVDGEPPGTASVVLTAQQCNDDALLEFTLTDFTTGYDVYVFTGNDCDTVDERVTTGSDQGNCTEVTSESIGGPTLTLELRADTQLGCHDAKKRYIWFLPLNNPTDEASVPYGCQTLESDTSAPEQVTGVQPSSGEHVAPISWDADGEAGTTYIVVWADAPGGGGDSGTACGGSDPFPEPTDGRLSTADLAGFMSEERSSTSYDVPKTNSGAAWVAVAAEDDNDNIGPLSDAECVVFSPAYSFSELYEMNGGDFDGGCSATRVGTRGTRDGHGLGTLALALGLLLGARRRL